MTDNVEYHTRQIERHAALVRGEEPDPPLSPDDYRIPSGAELSLMREACGLSVREVSDWTNRTPSHIYNVERDDSAPGSHLLVSLLRLYRREWPDDAEVEA